MPWIVNYAQAETGFYWSDEENPECESFASFMDAKSASIEHLMAIKRQYETQIKFLKQRVNPEGVSSRPESNVLTIIKEKRQDLGLTVRAFVHVYGLDFESGATTEKGKYSQVSNWEKRGSKVPSKVQAQYSKIFDMPIDELFDCNTGYAI